MKKVLMLVLGLFLFTSFVYAETDTKRIIVENLRGATDETLIAIRGRESKWTKSFSLKQTERMVILYRGLGASDLDMRLRLEQSDTQPSVECVTEDTFILTNNSIPTAQDNDWHIYTIDTITSLPFARIKIDGFPNNANTSRIQLKVGKQ